MSLHKIMFNILLGLINIFGLLLLAVIFLGASNFNGEGAPMISETEAFFRKTLYAFIISFFVAGLSFLLGLIYRNKLDSRPVNVRNLFLIELIVFMTIFFVVYFYQLIRFN